MTHLDVELTKLKEGIHEMLVLCKIQLEKAKVAFLTNDVEIAEEIIHNEKLINSMELSIDRDIENIFALFQPVATDLRFVIAMQKVNSDLERIGDYADGIAQYVVDLKKPITDEAFAVTRVGKMFDIAISMIKDLEIAFVKEDSVLARKVYKKDRKINEINRNSSKIIEKLVKDQPENIRRLLFLFSTIRKIERIGDHIKNIAEDIIFHLDAVVLKRKRQKKAEKQK